MFEKSESTPFLASYLQWSSRLIAECSIFKFPTLGVLQEHIVHHLCFQFSYYVTHIQNMYTYYPS